VRAIEQVLSAGGWKINTAFGERLNLNIRQHVAAVERRGNTPCKGEDGLQHQLALFHGYHHFVLLHASLCQPLLVPEATNGRGSAKVWRPCTPAMAAGLTDHVWTLKEVLLYRVPPCHNLIWCKELVNMMTMRKDSTSLFRIRSRGLNAAWKIHFKG
jgi:hypothetical protein